MVLRERGANRKRFFFEGVGCCFKIFCRIFWRFPYARTHARTRYTHVHTRTRYTHTHPYTHTRPYASTHAHTRTRIRTHALARIHSHARKFIYRKSKQTFLFYVFYTTKKTFAPFKTIPYACVIKIN